MRARATLWVQNLDYGGRTSWPVDRDKTRRLARALVIWGIVVVPMAVSMAIGPPPPPGLLPWWIALMGLVAGVGFPLVYAMDSLASRMRGRVERWWDSRRPAPVPTGRFAWTGRPWRRLVAALGMGIVMLVFLLLPLSDPHPFSRLLRDLLTWLSLAFFPFLVVAAVTGYRPLSFEVDEEGVRVTGRFRYNVRARWEDLAQVEVGEPPGMQTMAWLGDVRDLPRSYALRSKEGAIVGILNPAGELGGPEGRALEAALQFQAVRRGIPMVVVGWNIMARWKPRKTAA